MRPGLAGQRGLDRLARSVLAAWLGVIVALATATPDAAAQGVQGKTGDRIVEIQVVGSRRIEPATVLSYMQVAPGDTFDDRRLDESLKSLFGTGLFNDVTLRREGTALIVQVVENPIINRIAFEGNDRLDDEALDGEVSLRPRIVFTRTKVQNDVQRILDLYRRSGRFAATVEPKVVQLPENRVDLIFEIDEGPATGIRRISFIGNERFGDRTLRGVIQTVESRFYRVFTSDDSFDPDRLTFDRELLRRFYLSEGYADFRVVSAAAELTQDREDFVITFTVEEGPRYRFGSLDVSVELGGVDRGELIGLMVSREGEFYDADEVEESIQAITDSLGARGFAFVDVRPRVRRDRDARTLDIVYEIREGPRVYVERIDITGNVRTLDKVVRREFQIVEGDAFNTAKLRRSRQRLNNLGFFSRVEVDNTPGSAPDRTVVVVDVQEQSTGELSIGAGFSTTAGALADLSVRERNLLGRGQDLRLGLTIAAKQQQVDLSFTEPYFLGRDLSAGFDVFRRITNLQDQSSFNEDEIGGGLRAGYQLTQQVRHNVRYALKKTEIKNVDAAASAVIQSQEGSFLTSLVGSELFLDRLDSRLAPSDGFFASHVIDVAGLGGDVHYVRNKLGSGYFVPIIGPQVVLSLTGEAGYIAGLGENVRVVDRFFLGGDNLRGFKSAGVGPRDLSTDDALGGNAVANGTLELRIPLGLPEELGISGAVFSDFGVLTDIDESSPSIIDAGSVRASAGVGVAWRSPFGPMRLDLARPVVKEDEDVEEVLRFSFGTRF